MQYNVLSQNYQRIRLRLEVPYGLTLEKKFIESSLSEFHEIKRVRYNPRLNTVIVSFHDWSFSQKKVLNCFESIDYHSFLPKKQKPDLELRKLRNKVLFSGTGLFISSVMPPNIKLVLTLISSVPFIYNGIKAMLKRKLNVELLDASSITVAILRKEYGTAGVIAFLLNLSEYIEEKTKESAKDQLSTHFKIKNEWVWLLENGIEKKVDVNKVDIGDLIVVQSGTIIPVDGVICEGEALVNQASMTGESAAKDKRIGAYAYAGTLVEEGRIVIKAEKVGGDTRMALIQNLLDNAELSKAEIVSYAENLADKIVPYSFLLSLLTFGVTRDFTRAVSVLLVDFSCAIKLSTPLTIMNALKQTSKDGILVKGGIYLEKMTQIDAFIFDKTGTLTEGKPEVVDVHAFNGYEKNDLIKNAACVEEHFPHPVASAIVRKAELLGLDHLEEGHSKVELILANGVKSTIKGKPIAIGSKHFMEEVLDIDLSSASSIIKEYYIKGFSILYIAMNNTLAGIIALDDPIRKESKNVIHSLQKNNRTQVYMLTGDSESTANRIAENIGIKNYVSEVFPDDKVKKVQELKSRGFSVVMVGDGMNDSPALKYSDVGISMNYGADIAKESCDILFFNDDLDDIVKVQNISKETLTRINENFKYVIGINSALIGLSLFGWMPPILSALMHNATTVAVGLNSLKPLKYSTNGEKKENEETLKKAI